MEDELPNSLESEKVVLGRIFSEPSLLDEVKKTLTPDRFYNRTHQMIYSAMLQLQENEQTITPISVNEIAQEAGIGYLCGLLSPEITGSYQPIGGDVQRIISTSRKRWIVRFAGNLDSMARNGKSEDEIIETAVRRLDDAKSHLPDSKRRPRFLSEMIDDQAARYRSWFKGISNAVATGFPEIDDHLLGGGLVRSGLYVLAARPSMGKTALALDIAANMAGQGKTIYIVSREMPGESLFDRLHSAYSGVERWKLRPGIYEQEYKRLTETLEGIAGLKIILDDSSNTVLDLVGHLKAFRKKGVTVDCLMADYLQLFDGKGRSRNEEVGANSRAMKKLAMEFNFPVFVLSQLNRDSDRGHREPELMDLRDSGEIEQDADAVFFLFGDRQAEGAKFFSRQFKCAKQRDGELFRKDMTFNSNLVTFRTMEQLGGVV
jgi:replicative DNA helicase